MKIESMQSTHIKIFFDTNVSADLKERCEKSVGGVREGDRDRDTAQ